jgi:hypothetical protein
MNNFNNNQNNQNGNFNQNQQNIPNNNFNQQMNNNPFNQSQQDNYMKNEHNQQSYKYIEQESMQEYYNYKQSKVKLVIFISLFTLVLIFILGAFTSPFINGNPTVLDEQSRSVLSYTNNIKNKVSYLFSKDSQYYDIANQISIHTYKSDINLDNQLTAEISSMDKILIEFKLIDKSQRAPIGFDGKDGLHQQMIAIIDLRSEYINDLRLIAQGQNAKINEFNQIFKQYMTSRNAVINNFNAKYEVNYHKSLFDMKGLGLNATI